MISATQIEEFNRALAQRDAEAAAKEKSEAQRRLEAAFTEMVEQASTPPIITPTGVDAILAERGSRYGTFVGHAEVTQDLKDTLKRHLDQRGKLLAADQQEALDMICHKIGRIINGDPNYDDSWVDIAGYAKLVADRLKGKVI